MKEVDVLVIGSGFGGSVSALRLVEKGYSVCVVEAGRRFEDKDFPKTSWRLKKFLFAPKFRLYGIQRIHILKDVLILAGAGVGGGSLVYANTLYRPTEKYFNDPQWKNITDWKSELDPWYDQAERMLGVAENPTMTPSDEAILEVATQLGLEHTFRKTPVGVFFSDTKGTEYEDPYFGGVGPTRRSCIECGECMTGCRHNAKNTLLKNYLYLGEKAGAEILANQTVIKVERVDESWVVTLSQTDRPHKTQVIRATHVIFAAGTYGTQKLLHKFKLTTLPELSPRLGELSRTNSESLVGTIMQKPIPNYSQGVAITSSFFPDEDTHVEPVRYGKGSNSMGLLQTLMTDGLDLKARRRQWLRHVLKSPLTLFKILNVRRWSERTIIALVMQSVDSAISVKGKMQGSKFLLTTSQDQDRPNATWIQAANDTARAIAKNRGGIPAGHIGDLVGAPFTAHFVGGCVIGSTSTEGVIDPYHRVWNYPTLHIVDGSTITANLGVNPSLTITAQAERAMSFWPNKGEEDPRPQQGTAYQQIAAVAPLHPVVPDTAPARLFTIRSTQRAD
ncbi:MAG: GMC family oxidoreductase N-terminal domain-containing protein [Candidatus Nanopelagicales bacterium]